MTGLTDRISPDKNSGNFQTVLTQLPELYFKSHVCAFFVGCETNPVQLHAARDHVVSPEPVYAASEDAFFSFTGFCMAMTSIGQSARQNPQPMQALASFR